MMRWMIRVTALFLLFSNVAIISAQSADRPLIMPVAGESGAGSWYLGQAYGNTTGAYNFGDQWYRAGQGLHFGIDLSMPCGTELVSVADGVVMFVDDEGFGSMPHNLIMMHGDIGVTSLYGHLLNTPIVSEGQRVTQGQVVGYSGDPDETCDSRPHLHFEVRSPDYSRTINPVRMIDANWHSLSLIGPFGYPLFERDLDHPRQWISVDAQPDVFFWGAIINNYAAAYPPKTEFRQGETVEPARTTPAIEADTTYVMRQVGTGECCGMAEWHLTAKDKIRVVDGVEGSRASVIEFSLTDGTQTLIHPAPIPYYTPQATYAIEPFINDTVRVRNLSDDTLYTVTTGGRIPTMNPSESLLLWTSDNGRTIPGQARPENTVFASNVDGSNTREIFTRSGAVAQWIDDEKILISMRNQQRETTLYVYDLTSNRFIEAGIWSELRGISVSPGGQYITFYLSWQDNPDDNGVYLIDVDNPMSYEQLSWFGAWRWRDSGSLYYVPYEPQSFYHTLRVYDIETGLEQTLADPSTNLFTIADGHWEVSPDGTRILFQNALDMNLTILEQH